MSIDTLMVGRMLRLRISKRDLMERLYTITHLHSYLNTNPANVKVNTGHFFLRLGTDNE